MVKSSSPVSVLYNTSFQSRVASMLAVQQQPLAMASGPQSEPNASLPFGYSVEALSFANAPDPPHGAPLLSEYEHEELNNFFKTMTSNRPDLAVSNDESSYSEALGDLPPDFMGSTSYYGHNDDLFQSQAASTNFLRQVFADTTSAHFSMLPSLPGPSSQPAQPALRMLQHAPHINTAYSLSSQPSPISPNAVHPGAVEQQPSADVLEAASVLQNGTLGRIGGLQFEEAHGASLGHRSTPLSLATDQLQPPAALVSPLGPEGDAHEADESVQRVGLDVFTAIYAGAEGDKPQSSSSVPREQLKRRLRWGSDTGFNDEQYRPQSNKETPDALATMRLRTMECLGVSPSTNATQPSNAAAAGLKLKARADLADLGGGSSKQPMSLPQPLPQPLPQHDAAARKRRRIRSGMKTESGTSWVSQVDGEGEGESSRHDGSSRQPWRKRKGRTPADGHGMLPPSPSSPQRSVSASEGGSSGDGAGGNGDNGGDRPAGRRRRQSAVNAANQAKMPRENLSEEQKRENHIKSEQKRRTLIKEGFDDLCIMVPSLRGGGFSKSVMLTMTADWLEELVLGNARLREQLQNM